MRAYLCMHACVGTTYVSTCALNHYHTHHLLMHWVINSKTVSAVLWIVACLEAKFGTSASTILVTIGSSRSHSRGTILLNASRACKFTLLLASVSRGRNASNTYKNATCMVSCNADKYLYFHNMRTKGLGITVYKLFKFSNCLISLLPFCGL